MNQLIIAPIILPAALAGLIVLMARRNLAAQRMISGLGVAALTALAVVLLLQASAGPQGYFLGHWPAPFGIALMLDRLTALMLALVAGLSAVVLLYVVGSGWDKRGAHFHTLFLFQLMGLNGAFLTADAFNLFVFFEVLLIASYGLMVHGGGADRLRAGVQYVAFNLLGSTLFLFGLSVVYAVLGTLNMADMAVKLAALPPGDAALMRVAAMMLLLVFAIKGALVPLQFWLPGTYAAAPGPVAALFAVMTKVGAYAVIRLGTLIFGAEATAGLWAGLLWPAALITIGVGAVGVLGARGLARMVAFAAIGSMGVLFLAVSADTPAATAAALYYLLHSTMAMAVLFLLADLIGAQRGDGLTPAAPLHGGIAALFMVAAIAMAGMPPLSGFIGKLQVMDALRDPLEWGVILAGSFLTMLGLARAGSVLFWKTEGAARAAPAMVPVMAIGVALAALVAQTVFAGPLMEWLTIAADALHDPATSIAVMRLGVTP
jgi:multicomponent K+:H+ antiporter subunit D